MANLALGLLGPLQVMAGQVAVKTFESDKARALLAFWPSNRSSRTAASHCSGCCGRIPPKILPGAIDGKASRTYGTPSLITSQTRHTCLSPALSFNSTWQALNPLTSPHLVHISKVS